VRTRGAALPVPAPPGPPHPRSPTATAAAARVLALGHGPRRHVHQRDGHPDAHLRVRVRA
jgi:hypothetical protein